MTKSTEELIQEREKLVGQNETAATWGAAVGARHERIKEIDQELRRQKTVTKASNPKDVFGVRKVPLLSVIPLRVLAGPALGMLEGALKYSRHNYRQVGVLASVYVDACMRHVAQFWEGEDIDRESKAGLHHLDKAICSLMVLRDGMLRGLWIDDRPPKSDSEWLVEANKIASDLIDMFPEPKTPVTELNNGKEQL